MKVGGGALGQFDALIEESLNHRLRRQEVVSSNLVNAETPGFRALGYDFEAQLQSAIGEDTDLPLRTTHDLHVRNPGVTADGRVEADLYVKPTESIGNDGNTVDVDQEMSDLAANQLLYRATVELLNRRMGLLRYGINGGRV